MKIHVVGGDARFVRLSEQLSEYGESEKEAYIFGSARALCEGVNQVPADALVMAFSTEKICAGRKIVNLLEDEEFLRENAQLTAEGAIVCAANFMKTAFRGSKCLVVGFGRIGQELTDLLVGMRAQPVVYARREESRRRAMQRGAIATESLEDGISGAKAVFSTPPEMVLSENILTCAAKDAVILDLASAPFGVDLEAAQRLGLSAWIESGVPGRYCPESAAFVLESAVKRIIDRERSNFT